MSRLFSLVIDKEMIEHIPFNKFNIDKNKLKFMFFVEILIMGPKPPEIYQSIAKEMA